MGTMALHSLAQLESGQLDGIKHLKISEKLTSFPRAIFRLSPSLEILDLSDNLLTDLPDELVKLSNLKIIFASQNKFEHLPLVLGKLPHLEMIGFKSNKINHVPEASMPKQLRWLILTDNQLTKLPESLGHCHRLQKLALAGNQLTALPVSLSHAKNLELLRISANQLSECPSHILTLPKLAWFAFAGNPFSTVTNQNKTAQAVAQISSADFSLGEVLGQGASGVIYKASWQNTPALLPQSIAVKVFKGQVTSDGYPEDELLACLQVGHHANLVKSLAQVKEQHCLALVMNLIPSTYKNLGLPPSFKSCTRDTFDDNFYLPIKVISLIVEQMQDVFTHMHNQHICHGDLYAHNTLFNQQGQIIFGDFGASSPYQMLSIAQQHQIKRIEQRALIHFIEDLLSICDEKDKTTSTFMTLKAAIT